MINTDELFDVGKVVKTHGVNGEMSVLFTFDAFEEVVKPDTCLIFDFDGIYVPFFVASSRRRGNESMLITLEGESSRQEASAFVGKSVYMNFSDLPSMTESDEYEGVYANDLVGYHAIDNDDTDIGEIVGIDDNTENVLFVIARGDGYNDVLVPAVDEMIEDIDHEKKILRFNLPQGLLDI